MIKSSPAIIIVTVITAALGVGVGLIIGYLIRAPEEEPPRSLLQGRLNTLGLIKAGDNETVTDMFKQCRKAAGNDPAITE